MKKVILGLALVFAVSFSASVDAKDNKAKKESTKTEASCSKDAKACDKKDAKACDKAAKACDKDAKACDKKAEKKGCCAKDKK